MKALVACGWLQRSEDRRLKIDENYIRVFEEATRIILEGLKTKGLEVGQDSEARPQMYRGKSNLENQFRN